MEERSESLYNKIRFVISQHSRELSSEALANTREHTRTLMKNSETLARTQKHSHTEPAKGHYKL